MSLDLLHAGPMFLVSFAVAATALLILLSGIRRGASWGGRVVAVASVTDFVLGVVQQDDTTARGLLWAAVAALWLVAVPVLIGARALMRWKTGLSTSPALVYAGALLLGVGSGWILLPIVLGLLFGVFTALGGRG
jgi:hypothetical protein